jgi:hypothetical protein
MGYAPTYRCTPTGCGSSIQQPSKSFSRAIAAAAATIDTVRSRRNTRRAALQHGLLGCSTRRAALQHGLLGCNTRRAALQHGVLGCNTFCHDGRG